MQRVILAVLLLGLILAPLETLGILRQGTQQLGEVVSGNEAQVFVTKLQAELPSFGARISELLKQIFPPLDLKVKEVR